MTQIYLKDILPIIEEKLDLGGEVTINPGGVSMEPLVKAGRDSVVLTSPHKLKKYDVVLYKRENGQFILHRIVGKKGETFTMCGDNQTALEYGIKKSDIIAKMSLVIRDNKKISVNSLGYKLYSVLRVFTQRMKYYYYSLRGRLGRLKRKILG